MRRLRDIVIGFVTIATMLVLIDVLRLLDWIEGSIRRAKP